MRARLVALAMCLPSGSVADGLSFEFWPTVNPDQSVSCMIRLAGGMVFAVEVQGPGLPAPRPMRWPVRSDEILAMTEAMAAFVQNELGLTTAAGSRLPQPPFATVTWIGGNDQDIQTGLYIQKGLSLPPILARAVQVILPGGACDRLANEGSLFNE